MGFKYQIYFLFRRPETPRSTLFLEGIGEGLRGGSAEIAKYTLTHSLFTVEIDLWPTGFPRHSQCMQQTRLLGVKGPLYVMVNNARREQHRD